MWKDPIVEETRSRREELARRFNYDLKAIGEVLRQRRKADGQKPLTRPPKRVKRTALINAVSDFGLACPMLCSPEELMGEDDA